MPTLESLGTWHVELRGVRMGGAGNCFRFLEAPEGLGVPDVQIGAAEYALADGASLSGDSHAERVIRAQVAVIPAPRTGPALWEHMENLRSAFLRSSSDLDLWVRIGGGRPLRYRGRPSRFEITLYDAKTGYAEVAWEFRCGDPVGRAEARTATTSAATGDLREGREYPREYPLSYGLALDDGASVGSSDGRMLARNTGNYPATWRAEVVGPVRDFILQHLELGKSIRWIGTVEAGQTLTIDSRTRVVLLDGASAFAGIAGAPAWFSLPPGTSTVTFTAGSGTGSCTLSWESTWM
jgi:hypothetical protein